nr:unnamed protein product [Callosobruchus chinensis]
MNPTLSTRKMSEVTGISRSSIQRILKHYKWHPYKIQLLHELNEDDHDRRLQFCEIMSQLILNHPNYLLNICFSDECSFLLMALSIATTVATGPTLIQGFTMRFILKILRN